MNYQYNYLDILFFNIIIVNIKDLLEFWVALCQKFIAYKNVNFKTMI